jgi:hypothetical protein
MPLGRILLKSISKSRKLATLKSDGARLLYTWLLPHLNINGCYEADPLLLRNHVFSRLDKSVEEISEYLNDMESVGLVIRYSANGDIFLYVPDFVEKQPNLRPEREGKTHIPKPTPNQLRSNSAVTPAQVKLNKVNINKDSQHQPSAALKAILEQVSIYINIYSLINRLKKEYKAKKTIELYIPDEVLIKVGECYLKNKDSIKEPWPWFCKAIEEAWKEHNALEHQKANTGKRAGYAPAIKEMLGIK